MRNLAVACAILTTICVGLNGTELSQGDGKGSVSGRIVDPLGRPLEGARVSILHNGAPFRFTVSDVRGEFDERGMPDGTYEMTATLRGFRPHRRQFNVNANSITTIELGLTAGSIDPPAAKLTLVGTVQFVERVPRDGVIITLRGIFDQNQTSHTRVSESGKFTMSVNDPGQYVVYASRPGFLSDAQVVLFLGKHPSESHSVNLKLQKIRELR